MQHATYFEEFLRDEVNLNKTRLKLLVDRVEAVYKTLKADPIIGPLITGKIPQGSWPQRLIIKPHPGGDFDADFLLEFVEAFDEDTGEPWEPKRYIQEVYNALHRDATYCKQDHGKKCRCVYLEYAPVDEIGCHLDIVPFITLSDGRRVIVNRDNNEWEPGYGSTDPAGFSTWVKRRDELSDNNFRKVARLLKYLRDERGSFNGVKSVILTTLLGLQVTESSAFATDRYDNLPTALLNIVEDLDNWMQLRPTKPTPLLNPNGDGTNFDHRWEQATYANFRDRINSIAASMRAAYDEPDKAKSIKAWQAILGDNFTPPPPAAKTASASKSNPFAKASAAAIPRTSRSGRAG